MGPKIEGKHTKEHAIGSSGSGGITITSVIFVRTVPSSRFRLPEL